MLNLALWLKQNGFRLDQVQTFLPTPMALATAMYHSRRNPLKRVTRDERLSPQTASAMKTRRLHKAFLRYHDPKTGRCCARRCAHGPRRPDRQRQEAPGAEHRPARAAPA
jgi:radical SAM superfamily enzyme YgiQ (UPF0313 family)